MIFEYFKRMTQIEHVPSHDTFSRVLRMVNFEGPAGSLGKWLEEMFPEICQKYKKTTRKDNAMIYSALLKRFCMMMKKHDKEYSEKPIKRFLMTNEHNIDRIEVLLFGGIQARCVDIALRLS